MSDREDTVSLSPGPEPVRRPEHIEIGTSFDTLEVDSVLQSIAETNELSTTWQSLQQTLDALISKQCKIMEEKVIDEAARKEIDELSMNIKHNIHDHKNCPFTIQRLCELLIEPTKYYTMYIKYLRAVEKVLAVTSYWEDYATKDEPMETVNASNGEGLFPQSIDYIELERHNFDVDDEEPKKDQEETVETKESALTKEKESASEVDVGLKPVQEKVDKEVEKQEIKMDLD